MFPALVVLLLRARVPPLLVLVAERFAAQRFYVCCVGGFGASGQD